MIVKTVRASPKGQLTLPITMLRAMKLKGSTEFLVVQDGERIVLTPAATVGQKEVDDLANWQALAMQSLEEVWDNPEDEAWNDA